MKSVDLVIVGGGPAGLAAAIAAREQGITKINVIEREKELGGILNQCIHNGFGLHTFHEELTGPEYAKRYVDKVSELGIECLTETMVVDINKDKVLTISQRALGIVQIQAKAIILAMGCRERPRGALRLPGYRPSGIYTAGTAQYLVNIEGKLPGNEVVILGSGDIGLIMARRLTLEGANVKLVAELLPYSGGLKRNIVQCLDDYDIPLLLNHTITKIHGKDRLTGVTIAEVDKERKPLLETEQYISCDALLLSVGLIPENELSSGMGVEINDQTNGPMVNHMLSTNIPGVFACGNVLHVHDLVDYVSEEASAAGKNAATYLFNLTNSTEINVNPAVEIGIKPGFGIRYTVPMKLQSVDPVLIRFRVTNVYRDCTLVVTLDDQLILEKKKRIMAPGEMEQIQLTKPMLCRATNLSVIKIFVQEGVTWKEN